MFCENAEGSSDDSAASLLTDLVKQNDFLICLGLEFEPADKKANFDKLALAEMHKLHK